MKAAVIHEFGDVDVLKYEDIATPKPKPGHILIKVLAAGVNRLDHYLREGSVVPELPFPHILGTDAAGEVFELGADVTGLEVGERVIVVPGYPTDDAEADIRPTVTAPSFALPGLHITGTYAQYIEVPARAVVKDETGLSPEEVATLPITRTLVSGQFDDDADGVGNACDFDYDQLGFFISPADFADAVASIGFSPVENFTCGTVGFRLCGLYDHDGVGSILSPADFAADVAKQGFQLNGPSCGAACTPPFNTTSPAGWVLGKAICNGFACSGLGGGGY